MVDMAMGLRLDIQQVREIRATLALGKGVDFSSAYNLCKDWLEFYARVNYLENIVSRKQQAGD